METKCVVVLPGCYNPPTKAHLALLIAGVDALGAQKGLFVPASYAYVLNKLEHKGIPNETMPDALRWKLLLALVQTDARLGVDDAEITRNDKVSTLQTLDAVQKKYPGSEVFLLVGSDKLDAIPHWRNADQLMERYHLLVACRKDEDPWATIDSSPKLRPHRDRFSVFLFGEEWSDVRSTRLRDLLRSGDPEAAKLMTPDAYALLEAEGIVKAAPIELFRDKYFFLSNFFPCTIAYEGIVYGNAEAAFQAMKCMTEEERLPFAQYDAAKAKTCGRRVKLRPDWEKVKTELMEAIVRAKFRQNPQLAAMLLATGTAMLIEGNTWRDTFWGYDTNIGRGENHLGKILMKVRDELRRQAQ